MSTSTHTTTAPGNGATPHAPHHAKTKVKWWEHPRAKRVLKIAAAVAFIGFLSWLFFFYPFVSTDDARIASVLVRVAPEGVSGKVIKLNVDVGDRVKAGQVLIELDHSIPEANLAKAKAKASEADRDLKRVLQLARQNGIPPREVDKITAADQAANSELQLAQIAYDRTFIKTPTDGIVVQKVAELGNILEPDQTALTVTDIDHAWVAANIEETSIAPVRVGQPVKIDIDEGGALSGKVSEIRAATLSQFALIPADNSSGNFTKLVQRIPIKVALDPHPGRQLRAGQSVEIKIRVH